MEARIVPLPQPASIVRVDGDRIVIDRLVVVDSSLAAALAEREPAANVHQCQLPCAKKTRVSGRRAITHASVRS